MLENRANLIKFWNLGAEFFTQGWPYPERFLSTYATIILYFLLKDGHRLKYTLPELG